MLVSEMISIRSEAGGEAMRQEDMTASPDRRRGLGRTSTMACGSVDVLPDQGKSLMDGWRLGIRPIVGWQGETEEDNEEKDKHAGEDGMLLPPEKHDWQCAGATSTRWPVEEEKGRGGETCMVGVTTFE